MSNSLTDVEQPQNPPRRATALQTTIKLLAWLLAVFLNLFPGATYFADRAPPFFPSLGIFVSAFGIVIWIWSQHRSKDYRGLQGRNVKCLVTAILILVIYEVLLQYSTVTPPHGREGNRRQIGFYMCLLTDKARSKIDELANADPPIAVTTPNKLMNIFGVWGGEGRTDEIWPLWTILLMGFLLCLLFLVGFGLWVHSLAGLLRYFTAHE